MSEGVRLVVFDFAGTTIRDDGRVQQAMTAAFSESGIAVTPEQLARVRGMAKRQAIAEILRRSAREETAANVIEESFRRQLAYGLQQRPFEPIAGAAEIFRWLRSRGVRIALNSGFDRRTLHPLLDALGWTAAFDAVVCADDVSRGRPAPDMILHAMGRNGVSDVRRVASLGDTVADLEAAHSAGVRWNIGVLSGAHDRERLGRAPHTQLLASIAELRDFRDDRFADWPEP